jgi:hypothetical protein
MIFLTFILFIWLAIGYAIIEQLYNDEFGLDYPENLYVAIVYFIGNIMVIMVLSIAYWLGFRIHRFKINQYINGEIYPDNNDISLIDYNLLYGYKEKLFSPIHLRILIMIFIVTIILLLIFGIVRSILAIDVLLIALFIGIIIAINPIEKTIIIYKNGIFSYKMGTELNVLILTSSL